MGKWFGNDCEEINRLQDEIEALNATLKSRDGLVQMHIDRCTRLQNWIDDMNDSVHRANIKCEMYDQIMKGLNINVNLSEKKK
jgi:hypothetical protein